MLNIDRLEQYLADGRLLRRAWRGTDAQGRATACALAALSDDVLDAASQCPADDLPGWLAEMIPWYTDRVSAAQWPALMQQLARVLRRAQDSEIWRDRERTRRVMHACNAVSVREARAHVSGDARALAAIDGVLALLGRAAAGDEPTPEAAGEAAGEARAARAAAAARGDESTPDAWWAAAAAVWAARAAAAEAAAAAAAAAAGAAGAADRIAAGHLAAIDAACEAMAEDAR